MASSNFQADPAQLKALAGALDLGAQFGAIANTATDLLTGLGEAFGTDSQGAQAADQYKNGINQVAQGLTGLRTVADSIPKALEGNSHYIEKAQQDVTGSISAASHAQESALGHTPSGSGK